jgi:acyl homoserine lactone synthase
MRTFVHEGGSLPDSVDMALAQYRHQIFVEHLGWSLPMADACVERDQYDRDDTVYVIAQDQAASICGCARLLPTTRPYLLKELFAFLLAKGTPAPEAADVWELSRFAASPAGTGHPEQGNLAWVVRPMLASVVRCAAQLGARQLIGVTFLSMERLFRRIGIHAHRAGPAQCIDGRMVVACWIDIDSQTLAALDIDAATDASSQLIAPRKEAADRIGL